MGYNWTELLLYLLLVLVLVFLNGFFVAAEFALVKVRHSRLIQLANEGSGRAKYALKVTGKLDAYLSATQLGITLASLGLGWVGEPAISRLIVEPVLAKLGFADAVWSHTVSFIVAFCVITFLHIVLGELAPKSLAIQKSEGTSMWLSGPLMMFYKVFMPAIWLLNGTANRLLRLIGIQPATEHEVHTEEEIRILMNQSARSGIIDKDEMALFDNVFEFSDRLAREVMVPRTDMDCLYTDLSFAENLKTVYASKHTRYPVAKGDKDRIVGFVHITDLLTCDPDEEQELKTFIRPILTVPESMEVSHVLRLMKKKRSQIAVVIDEYGGTAGLVTVDDIVEEIVGEMMDEFDEGRPSVEVNGEVTSVDGRMLLEDINDMLRVEIEDDEVDSIGGWLFKQLEGMPLKGSKVEYGGYVFEVAEADRLRVVRVNISVSDTAQPAEDPAGE
ncbi:hemolysin family protein [Paenibacillus ginsengarvi]|uniref:HlyC/CorC family transporter n=1 Tax=Paenibacillus ginsengarvi TaxID=400777 RepID=A0A3B0CK92_9BACL|nr:hemolysin family protein [Paenibacillus ginsengarvi]RKN85632.1 HlyC/CorC family transporter [Paenibacillus ginsengarvi]